MYQLLVLKIMKKTLFEILNYEIFSEARLQNPYAVYVCIYIYAYYADNFGLVQIYQIIYVKSL